MNQRYLCAMQEAAVDTVQFLASDSVGFVSELDSIDVTVLDKPSESLFHDHLLQTTDLTWLERIDTGNTFVCVLIAICGAILISLQ